MPDFYSRTEIIGQDEIRVQLLSGSRTCCDVDVYDPGLGWFWFLMDNKRNREDLDGFAYNARRYLELVDEIVDDEVQLLIERYEILLELLNAAVQASLIILIVVSRHCAWLYVCASILVGLVAIAAYLMILLRKLAAEQFQKEQANTFQCRFTEFIKAEWEASCRCIGIRRIKNTLRRYTGQSRPIQEA
jgi:hypothetical protein